MLDAGHDNPDSFDRKNSLGIRKSKTNRNPKKIPRKRMRPPPTSSKSSNPPPKPAFQYFLEQMKGELRKHLPDLPDSEAAKHVSAKWKVMTDVEKEPFFVLEREEKKMYEDQIKKAKLEDESKDVAIKGETVAPIFFQVINFFCQTKALESIF